MKGRHGEDGGGADREAGRPFLAGAVLLARVPVDGGYLADVLAPLLLLGLGIGIVLPPIMGLAMSGAASDQVGVVSGLANSTGMIGGAFWTAVVASLSGAVTRALAAAGSAERSALRDGLSTGALAVACLLVVAAVVLRRGSVRDRVQRGEPRRASRRVGTS